ncbi:DEAD/DEAH box helicase family protein [Clostridium sp. BNL1100]|uniref:DEAD/DEAH box helicase family protein n=1 Tax=Clostridium sp. BNL1100 TaxID=755731 RepID=UPI00024A7AA0|nr:DEAD/DEAH box helicase family protein [Clostridium sp. BNL1100]AEY66616.1 DNA/RNA helicase, superfamily II [Clostridium sp. BNL1100]
MKEKVSDKITIKDIQQWKSEIITIKAPTGAGKSYFVKHTLYNFAKTNNKKILFLIHRINCVNQFQMEIKQAEKTDVIDIMTYQKLEILSQTYKKYFDFSEYQYIVCDEFHYFMGDAAFSKTTDISLNMILSQTQCCRIFMSATGDDMKTYINNVKKILTIDYELEINFDFIKNLTFFNKDESMEKFIEEAISRKDKGIFFIQSAKKAYELYLKYKEHCLFNCSKRNGSHYKYVDQDKIDSMLKNEKFGELILITTTCLDAGVNIIDSNLKHIVIDVDDIGSLIQCIGRKRIQSDDDKLYLYIKTVTNKQLGGKMTQLKNKIKMADYLRTHTVKEYIQEFGRTIDFSNIVYDDIVSEDDKGTKKINELMYFKCKFDLAEISIMLDTYKDYGYCKLLARELGFYDFDEGRYSYRLIDEDYKNDEIERLLDKYKGKALWKKDQETIINSIGLKDKRGRIQRSHTQLNTYFDSNNLQFKIIPKQDRRKIKNGKKNRNFNKTYWIISKNTNKVSCNS